MFLRNVGNTASINLLPSPKDIILIYNHCESFRARIVVQSVQNAALCLLTVVCVGSLWTGYSETWILCSLIPHCPRDTAFFFNQSYQSFHKNSVQSSIENNFVFPSHILKYVLKQQKLACCYYFKFFQLEFFFGGGVDNFHLQLTLICSYNVVLRPRPLSVGQLGYFSVLSMLGKYPLHA